jgi:hypothetical protein
MHSTDLETPAPVLPAKDQYESAINRSEHLPQAKNISEMVLDAFNTSGESEKIRELRAAIRQAMDATDDDRAHALMGELKQIKDAEQANAVALDDLASRFSISQILHSFRNDQGFEAIIYGLALKVLNHTHLAIKEPGGKPKASRPKKEMEVFTLHHGDSQLPFPIRAGRAAANLGQDAEAFALLGFSIEQDGEDKEVLVPAVFTDAHGVEHAANRKSIAAAIQAQTAFSGFSLS